MMVSANDIQPSSCCDVITSSSNITNNCNVSQSNLVGQMHQHLIPKHSPKTANQTHSFQSPSVTTTELGDANKVGYGHNVQ